MRIGKFLAVTILATSNVGFANPIEWKAIDLESVEFKNTPYVGVLKKAWDYSDVNGIHLLLLSQQDEPSRKNPSSKRKEYHALTATSFVRMNDVWTVEWQVKDNVDCPNLDSEVGFIYDQVKIEDVNNDRVAEVYLPYYYFCGGGLDPRNVKVIMRTDHLKFGARGESTIVMTGQKDYGGEVKFDKSLDEPRYVAFKKRILEIWKVVSIEKH